MKIMQKLITGISLILVMTLISAPVAEAATTRNVVYYLNNGFADGTVGFYSQFLNGNTLIEGYGNEFSAPTPVTQAGVESAIKADITSYASSQGYSLPDGIQFVPVMDSTVNSAIAAATSSLTLPQAMSFATTSRSLNSAFQVSSTRASFVSYTVDVGTTLSLSGGQTGTVFLEYADDSGFTTNVKTIQSSVNGNTGTLTIGLNITQTTSASLTGVIPSGKYVRLRTANTTGTPTFTFRAAQEVLLPSN